MSDRLYVIDGMAYAFRSYYAIRNLRDSSGRPTNAVFGFARMLLKILREHEPTHIAMVFDAPGKTFRDDLYPEYKANRDATPEDLIAQFPIIDELVEAFDIPILRVPGVEA
ncbi:MAG: DNA polymerase I, partial [Candidatus Hydrogenedentes bacterium]|nr:DNA polymerase I [Candidatus Hydrogenedentota bacterium]